jgi:L-threonylcarbamoyladenylate synthase
VHRVFAVKGRPDARPLLVLVDSVSGAEAMAAGISASARALMDRWWPGPLTIVLRAAPRVPDVVTSGTGTIGVRLSPHPIARALVEAFGGPVTAPSANPTGAPPPTTADGVLGYFDGQIEMVLDGGATAGGSPSTVVDATVDPPRVLRQGAIRL